MNKQLFQKQYAGELRALLESKFGQSLVAALGALRPAYEQNLKEHLMISNGSKIWGYELCLHNLLSLSINQTPFSDIEADYGIPNTPKKPNPTE